MEKIHSFVLLTLKLWQKCRHVILHFSIFYEGSRDPVLHENNSTTVRSMIINRDSEWCWQKCLLFRWRTFMDSGAVFSFSVVIFFLNIIPFYATAGYAQHSLQWKHNIFITSCCPSPCPDVCPVEPCQYWLVHGGEGGRVHYTQAAAEPSDNANSLYLCGFLISVWFGASH